MVGLSPVMLPDLPPEKEEGGFEKQFITYKLLRIDYVSSCNCKQHLTWITGSCVGSGKRPLRPAHSISKLRMRNGAILENSPSAGWLTKSVYLTAQLREKKINQGRIHNTNTAPREGQGTRTTTTTNTRARTHAGTHTQKEKRISHKNRRVNQHPKKKDTGNQIPTGKTSSSSLFSYIFQQEPQSNSHQQYCNQS